MKKTLFTAAIAFVLSVGGFVLSAEEPAADSFSLDKRDSLIKLVVESGVDVNLSEKLTVAASETAGAKTFGYVKPNGQFVSLVDAMTEAEVADGDTKTATLVLGKFKKGDTFQFGFGNSDGVEIIKVASDAGFNAGYNVDSFYHLDFSKDPFDGKIEIYVMGEPLPPSTVTLLVALAAAAAFLLYNNRRKRVRCS